MGMNDIIKKSVMEEFLTSELSGTRIVVILGVCLLISVYIHFVYKSVNKNTFCNRSFSISMSMISVIVAGIVIALQSNLVISLGMIGALSIVRFRTAVKEPMDLMFMFWSIATGIICGATLFSLAIIVALIMTIGLLVLKMMPEIKSPYLLIVSTEDKTPEIDILEAIKRYSPKYRIDSKNIRQNGMDMIVEIRTKQGNLLVDEVSEIDKVVSVSLLYHDGPVKN